MQEYQDTKQSKTDILHDVRPKTKAKPSNQDIGLFFESMKPWVLFVFIVIVCIAVVSIGALTGYLRYISGIREPESSIGTAVGATFGLLAFMLGFTFSLTWARFANRNSLVIAQAKAIQTCYLRTSLITEKQRTEIRRLLREYTKALMEIIVPSGLAESLIKIEQLHRLIWQQTASLAREDIDSELRSLFISSVNELISLASERKIIALVFRIPDPIWSALLFLAAMGMFAFGYETGMNGAKRIFQMPFLPIAFGIVIVLIADLNSSGIQRRFKVTQKPLSDILEMMDKDMG